MKKILILGFLIIINCMLDSCTSNNISCYDIEISTIKNYTFDGYVELNTGDTTTVNDYAILLDAETISETCLINYSFGATLLAEEPILRYTNKVTNISIKSNSDLSANYPAESELKNLFIPMNIDISCLDNSSNSSDCLYDYFSNDGSLSLEDAFNDLMSQAIFWGNENSFELFSLNTSENTISNNHEITIRFDFESGASTEFKTEQIILN